MCRPKSSCRCHKIEKRETENHAKSGKGHVNPPEKTTLRRSWGLRQSHSFRKAARPVRHYQNGNRFERNSLPAVIPALLLIAALSATLWMHCGLSGKVQSTHFERKEPLSRRLTSGLSRRTVREVPPDFNQNFHFSGVPTITTGFICFLFGISDSGPR